MKYYEKKRAFNLVELLIAVLLLGTVMLTGITIELAMRRMQIKPEAQIRLLDELIPVVERIRKDFQGQIGTLDNSSVWIESSGDERRLVIRVDTDNSGTISGGDLRHAYRWNGTVGDPIEYSADNSTFGERAAEGICGFSVSKAYGGTALNLSIGAGGYADQNVYLNTTIFSRMSSGR